jgi:hypothetical protein
MRKSLRALAAGICLIGFGLCCVHSGGRSVAAPPPGVGLKAVKYWDLVEEIRGLKGKVVVVEIWAEW